MHPSPRSHAGRNKPAASPTCDFPKRMGRPGPWGLLVMALPRLATLFPRSHASSLYFGPELPGGLLPEAAQALAREALGSKDEHEAIDRLARKYQVVEDWLSALGLPSNPLPGPQPGGLPMPSNVPMAGVAPIRINESRPAPDRTFPAQPELPAER